jgi:hypothetical protein
MTSTQQPSGPADPVPDTPNYLTHQHMDQALAGQAIPLGRTIRWFTRYQDTWWLSTGRGWIRCDDPQLTADLDDRQATLTALDTRIAREAGGSGPRSQPRKGQMIRCEPRCCVLPGGGGARARAALQAARYRCGPAGPQRSPRSMAAEGASQRAQRLDHGGAGPLAGAAARVMLVSGFSVRPGVRPGPRNRAGPRRRNRTPDPASP